MAGGLAHLWKEWGIQILVLFSFTLQVILLSFAGICRRKASAPLRLLLWLVYLLADSTAIFTLGHLSVVASSKAQEQQHLLCFWAPFLLVHLGGPGNITAYALEDNRLCIRHLLTLLVQVLGAAFVIYKYIAGGSRTLVLLAAVLVFVVGILSYRERTAALRCGNESSIRSSISRNVLRTSQSNEYSVNFRGFIKKLEFPFPDHSLDNIGDEELLLGAQSLFFLCQSIVDATIYMSEYLMCSCHEFGGKDVYGLVEMELSLMYDILYTKAAVFHTWYGYCILVMSPLATVTALLLFHSSNKYGDSKVNVTISCALLIGTLILETISVVRAIESTWACTLMYCCRWNRLLSAVTFLRRCFKAAGRRRWSGSFGQYNLLHLCTRDRTELGGRLATRLGLWSWWKKVHYSGTTRISTTDLKNHIQRSKCSPIT